ncbi:hypothetical protein [Prosthecochloris sp. HL-130-GSB]|uniref:DUF4411 family protein n=1 Tax=Prosthecochloris sp. HL-130-GSB TaxID=1974213 RepID=UPI0012F4CEC2
MSSWATTQGYTPAAISTFLQVADFYLLAHALAGEFTTPFDMLRRERAMFVLGQ